MAIGLLLISLLLYIFFESTKNKISHINKQANIEYVSSLAENLSSDIIRVSQKDLFLSLKEDAILKEYIESDLKLFVTTKYKYIYLVSKNKIDNSFMVLADSSRNEHEKQALKHLYQLSQKENFQKVFTQKKSLYIKHKEKQAQGASYLKPIIIDGIVEGIIVVEFSLQEQETIFFELKTLENMFKVAIGFFTLIFIFIIWFSIIDKKREKEKNIAFENLETETQKVHELNDTLEHKVAIEVEKNRLQDQQLVQQSRLAQMGEMISMIAHQWRQPLGAISVTSGNINLHARLNTLDKDTAIELTEKISEYSQHLSSTIDDFREFFKPNKERKKTNYAEILKSVLNIVEISINNKNIRLLKDLQCKDSFYTYPNEVKQVLLNLIKNAEDILLEKGPEKPYIKISSYKEENQLILEVSDNGGGVPEDIIQNIFDPYFSTKMQKGGTGLGLYMSKTIIEKHCHGKLIASNNQEGACFKIILGVNHE